MTLSPARLRAAQAARSPPPHDPHCFLSGAVRHGAAVVPYPTRLGRCTARTSLDTLPTAGGQGVAGSHPVSPTAERAGQRLRRPKGRRRLPCRYRNKFRNADPYRDVATGWPRPAGRRHRAASGGVEGSGGQPNIVPSTDQVPGGCGPPAIAAVARVGGPSSSGGIGYASRGLRRARHVRERGDPSWLPGVPSVRYAALEQCVATR